MDKIINPLDGEMDLLGDIKSNIVRKLNPLTGRLEVVYKADSYIQKINPFIGDFDMVGGTGASYIIKEATGNGYINLTNAVANHLMELKAYGGTEQLSKTYIDSVTAEGKCVQASTPTPTTPVDIACNNGTIKFSKNMANVNSQTALVGYYISAQGVITADVNNRMYQEFIPVKPSTTYTLSMSSSVYYVSISEYSTAEDSGFIVRKNGSTGTNTQLTITTGATTNYVRFGTNIDRTGVTLEEVLAINWQLERGSTATTYHEYVQGGVYIDGTTETITDSSGLTATCENLLSAGDYKDTQEILTGLVTRNVGILVLDGTETWAKGTSGSSFSFYIDETGNAKTNSGQMCMSNIAVGVQNSWSNVGVTVRSNKNLGFIKPQNMTSASTVTDWTDYITSQYNAGTPVIVIYPLDTATTETVTGQQLNIAPVTATGSVTGLVATAVTSVHTTPTPTQPLDINSNNGVLKVNSGGQVYADGTTETIWSHGKNLYDRTTNPIEQGAIASADGTNSNSNYRLRTNTYIPCRPNTTYNISLIIADYTSGSSRGIYVFEYSDTEFVSGSGWKDTQSYSFTTGATTTRLRFVFARNASASSLPTIDPTDVSNVQLELGSTDTSYEPYYNGGTATAEMLLKVGDNQDEQEILSGSVTRKVGIKVLDGTENWVLTSIDYVFRLVINNTIGGTSFFSHYQESQTSTTSAMPDNSAKVTSQYLYIRMNDKTSLTTFKQFLADQYNAGTPVIVVYSLNTPTTESVTGQTMHIPAGNSTIEITQASIDNLGLYSKYKATS